MTWLLHFIGGPAHGRSEAMPTEPGHTYLVPMVHPAEAYITNTNVGDMAEVLTYAAAYRVYQLPNPAHATEQYVWVALYAYTKEL